MVRKKSEKAKTGNRGFTDFPVTMSLSIAVTIFLLCTICRLEVTEHICLFVHARCCI